MGRGDGRRGLSLIELDYLPAASAGGLFGHSDIQGRVYYRVTPAGWAELDAPTTDPAAGPAAEYTRPAGRLYRKEQDARLAAMAYEPRRMDLGFLPLPVSMHGCPCGPGDGPTWPAAEPMPDDDGAGAARPPVVPRPGPVPEHERPVQEGAAVSREMMGEARDVGQSLDTDVAAKGVRAGKAMARAWAAVQGAVYAVGEAVFQTAEWVEQAAAVVRVVKAVRLFIAENYQAVGVVAAAALGAIALGTVGAAAAAIAVSGLTTATAAFWAVLNSPITLTAAAVGVAAAALAAFLAETEGGQRAIGNMAAAWDELAAVFGKTWGGIRDATAAGDLKLAMEVATAGINVVWKDVQTGVQLGWTAFKEDWVDGWHDLVTEVKVAVAEAAKAMQKLEDALNDTALGRLAEKARALVGAGRVTIADLGIEGPDQIRADARRAGVERRWARLGPDVAATKAVEDARARLDAVTGESEAARIAAENAKRMDKFLNDMMAGWHPDPVAGLKDTIAASSRTSFSGTNAWQALGIGGSVMDDIKKNTADAVKKLKGLELVE